MAKLAIKSMFVLPFVRIHGPSMAEQNYRSDSELVDCTCGHSLRPRLALIGMSEEEIVRCDGCFMQFSSKRLMPEDCTQRNDVVLGH